MKERSRNKTPKGELPSLRQRKDKGGTTSRGVAVWGAIPSKSGLSWGRITANFEGRGVELMRKFAGAWGVFQVRQRRGAGTANLICKTAMRTIPETQW